MSFLVTYASVFILSILFFPDSVNAEKKNQPPRLNHKMLSSKQSDCYRYLELPPNNLKPSAKDKSLRGGKGVVKDQHLSKRSQGAIEKKFQALNRFSFDPIDSEIVELEHRKSGARVVFIKNSDSARTFTVAFRTPPYDDTGVFHILEHSVLDGSRLFPYKGNANHVFSSSLASYINAVTYPDKTLYPFVTKDDKDFKNLLLYYMDAVFFPRRLEPRGCYKGRGGDTK